MCLFDLIVKHYPSLNVDVFLDGGIVLRDDSDGGGAYIESWNLDPNIYPIPEGLHIGKPQEQQE